MTLLIQSFFQWSHLWFQNPRSKLAKVQFIVSVLCAILSDDPSNVLRCRRRVLRVKNRAPSCSQLFMAQRFNRVELGGLISRVIPEEDPHRGSGGECHQN